KIDAMDHSNISNPLHKDPCLPELYTPFSKKKVTQSIPQPEEKCIQATHDMLQLEDPKCRKRVLRRQAFTTDADIVDMKGRVACEIRGSGNELLLTELVFNPLSRLSSVRH
ncbi:hypothetical protein BJ912DRAFT_849524, partial [Pholiota molesta]